jgi:hypothetical protein
MTRSNAVIVRAGAASLHADWRAPDEPNFDLIVAAYEALPGRLLEAADAVFLIPGSKVMGWSSVFKSDPGILERYDAIALIDDDLQCSSRDINLCFSLGEQYRLDVWQPSLSWDSYYSYGVFLNNPLFRLRYTNFIEMMCPFFSTEQLRRALPLFEIGLETGIDRLWCRLKDDWNRAYAVLDAVSVRHTRVVGQNAHVQGFVGENADYQTVIDSMERRIGVRFRGPVVYGGVNRFGAPVNGRLAMAACALAPLAGAPNATSRPWLYRRIGDHVRHILTRPIGAERVDLDRILEAFGVSQ